MVELAKKGVPLVLWKSDVQNAYRILAMALAWQLRQIVCIDNLFHVDRCANFGSAASPKIWCSFFSLVLWIARTRFGISRMNNLMDDTWGVSPLYSMVDFRGHKVPLDQAKLLLLFDLLNIPWEWKKQIQGIDIEIIGHFVRAKELSFSLPDDKKADLVRALREFTLTKKKTLREWQSILGWASWGLNSFPMGRWALQSSWEKISGKEYKSLVVPHNKTIQLDFKWLADHLERSPGNFFLSASIWSIRDADFLCTADACPEGLGIWLPNSIEGFHFKFPLPLRDIYWAELAATSHAILIGLARGAKKLFICSDSSNVCDLFLSHRPIEKVRPLFSAIITLILRAEADVRVCHLAGVKNVFADALSRNEISDVRKLISSAVVSPLDAFTSLPDGGFKPASADADQALAATTKAKYRQRVSPRTVEAYLSGIASAFSPTFPRITDFTNSKEVRDVMKGCKRQFSSPVLRKEPLTLQDLSLVHSSTPQHFDSVLFLAMITIGFHGLHRLGELAVPDNSRLQDDRKVIKRTSLVVSQCGGFFRYTLPYNKSDPFFLG
ncbi:uncharacterized protein MELLADRAFT_86490 [Melampsora larici-populina 98AG31]|uniref:Uncharacterized protein n=1 Tax=Melampsora larici-populina (strain 98AG31 / pathotype 3-4-7) TaxID=747676 RepID=F4RM11_MELLP|nr:uncharacterized protein MELLADRAFT_86490 [Melampsora larici-populina 98AG31]EGG06641.1 hypothetical protein MELLADRAFT_86490 [Melampsora larici-populina 98AG31]